MRHAKKESTFNVFLDENGTNELNVVKQLERLEVLIVFHLDLVYK